MKVESINGQLLREMLAAATNWLGKNAPDIDALNVFPVPDGDTGTNMLLTMRSSIDEAYQTSDHSVSTVTRAIAKGALMGARGNSGVILSQIWRGFASSYSNKEVSTAQDLAEAFQQAVIMAYKGLSNPVEGTILTVIKDIAQVARHQVEEGNSDLLGLLEIVVSSAADSLANTPNLLPVLKDAGVVDAGGQGLYTILEGALQYLKGEGEQMQLRKPQIIISDVQSTRIPNLTAIEEEPYGYCTNLLIKGENLAPDKIRTKLQRRGKSIVVAGDDTTIRIHIHTYEPGKILNLAGTMGTMHEISIRNMDEQFQDFLEMQRERSLEVDMATVVVASGNGLQEVFRSLGAVAIISGGQTMNPSTKDFLQAIEVIPSDQIIILPNNKNIILTAQQVQSFTDKSIKVIPTETIPQGVASLLAFDYGATFETNTQNMEEAISSVKTIEITHAVRSSKVGELRIKKHQAIGLLDGALLAAGKDTSEVLSKMLAKIDLEKSEIITIYYGVDTKKAEAELVAHTIREKHPELQIDIVRGDQPHYNYIVSIE